MPIDASGQLPSIAGWHRPIARRCRSSPALPYSADPCSALSLCFGLQPWASLLVAGLKRIEGRGWPTNHRGRLWIASTAQPPDPADIKVRRAPLQLLAPLRRLVQRRSPASPRSSSGAQSLHEGAAELHTPPCLAAAILRAVPPPALRAGGQALGGHAAVLPHWLPRGVRGRVLGGSKASEQRKAVAEEGLGY